MSVKLLGGAKRFPRSAPVAERAPGEDPVSALLGLGHAFRGIESALGAPTPWLAVDLSMGQLKALVLLAETGGVKAKTLASQLGTTPSAVTPLVDRLIAQKLARRQTDPDDRRVVWIRPTSRAMVLHQSLMHTRRPVLEQVWKQVPAEHRAAIHRSLELLLDAAEQVLERLNGGEPGRPPWR